MVFVRERSSQPLGPDPYAGGGDTAGVAWVRGTHRPAIELRKQASHVSTLSGYGEDNTHWNASGESQCDVAESETLSMCEVSRRENREIPLVSTGQWYVTASWNDQKTSPAVTLI